MESRVVITGAGAVSAAGVGALGLWRGLSGGLAGVKAISSFDAGGLACRRAAEVSNFEVGDYVTRKGIGSCSRSAQFVCAAAKLAAAGADFEDAACEGERLGIVLGTAYGSTGGMLAFDADCARDGVRFVDPLSFPNTVTNSPAGHLATFLGVAGLNVTLSTGAASGLDAIAYAAGALARGQVRAAFVGGYEEFSETAHRRLLGAGLLSTVRACGAEESVPLDRERNGFFLGEGAGVLLLERLEDALGRGAPVLAELGGAGTSFCADPARAAESEAEAMTSALEAAGVRPRDVGYVSASANGGVGGDAVERLSIEKCFGGLAAGLPVTAVKSVTGECGAASGIFQVIAAALSTRLNAVPPTRGFRAGDAGSRLGKISAAEQAADCGSVLVNSFNGTHQNTSVVVRKFFG